MESSFETNFKSNSWTFILAQRSLNILDKTHQKNKLHSYASSTEELIKGKRAEIRGNKYDVKFYGIADIIHNVWMRRSGPDAGGNDFRQ